MPETQSTVEEKHTRHILSLSGGKDSTALALYMRDRIPTMEYVFCDTGEELQETYDYLERIEAHLGKPIARLNPDRPFRHYLDLYRGVLPDPRTRWCTRMLKLKPFEKHVGNDLVCLYVGIRADEPHRTGYVSTKPNITAVFPFVEDGLRHKDILRILKESGIGLPEYYKWRSRSGCYFCFFQQRREWVGLFENHKDLFDKAAEFEKIDPETGESFTWVQGKSLLDISDPDSVAEIKKQYQRRMSRLRPDAADPEAPLLDVFTSEEDEENQGGCLICHL
jgi:3'-phosphoadenosine 5'-phosphosulfate sulfotransferase (PAPS reductase)/FAD synthetase